MLYEGARRGGGGKPALVGLLGTSVANFSFAEKKKEMICLWPNPVGVANYPDVGTHTYIYGTYVCMYDEGVVNSTAQMRVVQP